MKLKSELRVTFLQLLSLLIESNIDLINENEAFIDALETFLKSLLMNIADQTELSSLEGNLALTLIAQVINIGDQSVVERIFDTEEQLQRILKICMQYQKYENRAVILIQMINSKSSNIASQYEGLHYDMMETAQHDEKLKLTRTLSQDISSLEASWRNAPSNKNEAQSIYSALQPGFVYIEDSRN